MRKPSVFSVKDSPEMQDTSDGLVVPHRDTVVGYGGSLILHGSILLLLSLISVSYTHLTLPTKA